MAEAGSSYDVAFGDVSQSQIVIGDHTTVQTGDGVKIVYLVGEQGRPKPRLRHLPVAVCPSENPELVGRDAELALGRAAAAGAPLQLYGPDGIGKSALVKRLAHALDGGRDGVVFLRARGRPLDDIRVALYHALWECDVAYVPRPDELPPYLGERDPLVLLDDLDLDRDDVEALLDTAPQATFVAASRDRTLWSRGRAEDVAPLDHVAGTELLERLVGRALSERERAAAEGIAIAAGGVPQRIVEAAALVADGHATLEEIVSSPGEVERRAAGLALSDGQRRVLAVLAAVQGAALGAEPLAQVAGADAHELPELERRGWIRSASPRYRLARDGPAEADGAYTLVGLASWASHAPPGAVADETEAIIATVDAGIARDRLDDVLALVHASERKLALAGALGAWERVLRRGLRAAEIGVRPLEEGFMLHELGSRAACIGQVDEARNLLLGALELRVRAGDDSGADLTRHNLGQLGSLANGHARSQRWRRWLRPWLLLVLLTLAGTAAALVVTGGRDEPVKRSRHHHRRHHHAATRKPPTTKPPTTKPPTTKPPTTKPPTTKPPTTKPPTTKPPTTKPPTTSPPGSTQCPPTLSCKTGNQPPATIPLTLSPRR